VRLAAALALACALLVVPSAGASGASWTIVSGVSGDNGWYRSAVKVQITSSGSGTCPTSAVITFNQSSDTFQCTDSGQPLGPLQFNIDAQAPSVTGVSVDRAPDKNGWYTHPMTVTFQGTDGGSGLASCSSATYSGPDTDSGSASGTCRDKAGNVSSSSFALKYDATPPTVTAAPGRAATKAGWYNHPVSVTFSGTDATSGIDACTGKVRYAGPDTAAGVINGACTDQAGNQGSVGFPLKYDSTPPQISDVATSVADGEVTVKWQRSGGTTSTVLRAPGRGHEKVSVVYRGPALSYRDTSVKQGIVYHYTVASTDAAGNDARVKIATSLRQPTMTPAPGTVLRAGAALTWLSSPGASYYNVQLFRNGHKVLTAWPVTARFRLPRAWMFSGHHEKLAPGTYKWYVWPGHGARAAARYGRLLGGSTFRVR
jgi:hypothetical protein